MGQMALQTRSGVEVTLSDHTLYTRCYSWEQSMVVPRLVSALCARRWRQLPLSLAQSGKFSSLQHSTPAHTATYYLSRTLLHSCTPSYGPQCIQCERPQAWSSFSTNSERAAQFTVRLFPARSTTRPLTAPHATQP